MSRDRHDRAALRPVGRNLVCFDWTAMTSSPSSAPHVVNFTLANGLDVVVIPDHRAPVITHMVWYKVGAADETGDERQCAKDGCAARFAKNRIH